MRTKVLTLIGVVAIAAAALPALVSGAADDPKLIAKPMDGAQEIPGPGDDDGKGNAKITLKPDQDQELCFVIKWKNIEDPEAGHVHKGVEGKDGDIVVELFTDMQDESPIKDCIKDVEKKVLKQLEAKPEKFYVNIHNAEFEDGAIRGQLESVDGGEDDDEDTDKPWPQLLAADRRDRGRSPAWRPAVSASRLTT